MIPVRTKTELLRANIDLSSATVRVALLKNTTEYTPDPSAHEFVSDVLDGGATGEEYDDTNYSRLTLANQSVKEDNTDNEGVFDANDVIFPSLGSSVGGQVVEAVLLYQQIGGNDSTPSDDPILRIIDDSETSKLEKQTNGDDFTISWDAEGITNLA